MSTYYVYSLKGYFRGQVSEWINAMQGEMGETETELK